MGDDDKGSAQFLNARPEIDEEVLIGPAELDVQRYVFSQTHCSERLFYLRFHLLKGCVDHCALASFSAQKWRSGCYGVRHSASKYGLARLRERAEHRQGLRGE